MAHKMAVSAERAYRFETGNDRFFVEAGNWDASRAGLLAGERLLLQLQAMEASFLEQDRRYYDITPSTRPARRAGPRVGRPGRRGDVVIVVGSVLSSTTLISPR